MAVTVTTEKIAVALKLNNGQTATGGVKLANVALTPATNPIVPLSYNAAIATAREIFLALAIAANQCLSKSIVKVDETITNNLEED